MLNDFAMCFANQVGVIPLTALVPFALAIGSVILVRRAIVARDEQLPDVRDELHALR